jgi:hypothetical protein
VQDKKETNTHGAPVGADMKIRQGATSSIWNKNENQEGEKYELAATDVDEREW